MNDEEKVPGEDGVREAASDEVAETGARGDFIASLIMMFIGAVAVAEAYRMPAFKSYAAYVRPSFPPTFFGLILMLCAAIMLARSLAAGGYRLGITLKGAADLFRSPATRRLAFALAAIAAYFLLLGNRQVHFVAKTCLFLFVMMLYFRASKWWISLSVSVGGSFLIWALFYHVFNVPLP